VETPGTEDCKRLFMASEQVQEGHVLNGEVVAMFDEPAIFVKQADAFCRCVTTTAAQLVKLVKDPGVGGIGIQRLAVTGQCLLRAAKRVEFGKAEVAMHGREAGIELSRLTP
jgi:hypothetical protein